MNKTLLFLFFCFSFSHSHAMYIIPNEIVAQRGNNYTFQAVASESFDKYTITFDTDSIAFNSRRNSSHITVDYDVPSIMKLKIYSCSVFTFDQENYELENATYFFVIGNLTEVELFALFQINEDLQDEKDVLQQTVNNSSNYSIWQDYEYPESIFEKNSKYILIIGASISICVSIMGVAMIQQRYKAKEDLEEGKQKAKKAKENYAKAQLSKQAVSHSMDIYVPRNIEGEIIHVRLLNEWERDACSKYEKNCDASFFLRPKKEIEKKLSNNKLTSIEVIYYRLKEHLKSNNTEPDYTNWWYVFSAIVKYLQEKGYIKKNNNLFPVQCKLKEIKSELGIIYGKKEEQDFKLLKDESTEDDTQKEFEKAVTESKKSSRPKNKSKSNVEQVDVAKKIENMFSTI